MFDLISGAIMIALAAALMRICMPRKDGKPRWFLNTQAEPYAAIIVTVFGMFGLGLIVSGIVNLTLS